MEALLALIGVLVRPTAGEKYINPDETKPPNVRMDIMHVEIPWSRLEVRSMSRCIKDNQIGVSLWRHPSFQALTTSTLWKGFRRCAS